MLTLLLILIGYPSVPIMISTDPLSGPAVNQHYRVTCLVAKPVNGTLSVSWRRNGLIVKSLNNIIISDPISTATGSTLTMTFTNNINLINEGTYTCSASLLMEDYNIVLSNSTDTVITAPGKEEFIW